ncbi:riboflavin biosynthesis protein RibD [Candidatus Methylacidiphilum fumarolicum]|uniref:Riboflavin biosynthesis protein RibD n=3 Tax=Candidatus Methylacidiphilum fumarolicum TaxID=591154 RepID=I0JZK5_METFB|nr:bifunctional diaminohydroxyphosphoribosylaminopyrimidine deaminase/5-amino-6-(5-phosphoribosylamino)uracil reductase RibD [Candidatus Methylacidiphilum fumarolicum]TFE69010.1 riboflavin biosynthesis protein RibD [Candidatus Methylacidiphilum fumarolicum]TFE74159.1 riboflavin biosynthesis protein RibD [Candidatus Methylacidiphilum fumarolicum]CAI9085226.1 Diaminohydroxyphosphoribosylaminopyrimidine deaminase,5-amino-6-(5-phosphoribosylamino)uracil reductase [Candidatus Methylacidiphilum fumaro
MKSFSLDDRYWMQEAFKLALLGEGLTSPNPSVGAVIVKNGIIIGKGYHKKAGAPHAEIEAIEDAKRHGYSVSGSTLYVTLEPCTCWGKTPPCSLRIIEEKISRVVAGSPDPNPKNKPRAMELFRAQGIDFSWEIHSEAIFLNRGFYHWIVTGKPWVIGKMAMAIDGSFSAGIGDEKWISGLPARTVAHTLRMISDGILIGAQTARHDNPLLTIRHVDKKYKVQPWRAIVSLSGRLPKELFLFTDSFKERTLLFVRVPLEMVLEELGSRTVTTLLVEGGKTIFQAFLSKGLIHEVAFFLSPLIIGKAHHTEWGNSLIESKALSSPIPLIYPSWENLKGDIYCRGLLLKGAQFLEEIRNQVINLANV